MTARLQPAPQGRCSPAFFTDDPQDRRRQISDGTARRCCEDGRRCRRGCCRCGMRVADRQAATQAPPPPFVPLHLPARISPPPLFSRASEAAKNKGLERAGFEPTRLAPPEDKAQRALESGSFRPDSDFSPSRPVGRPFALLVQAAPRHCHTLMQAMPHADIAGIERLTESRCGVDVG